MSETIYVIQSSLGDKSDFYFFKGSDFKKDQESPILVYISQKINNKNTFSKDFLMLTIQDKADGTAKIGWAAPNSGIINDYKVTDISGYSFISKIPEIKIVNIKRINPDLPTRYLLMTEPKYSFKIYTLPSTFVAPAPVATPAPAPVVHFTNTEKRFLEEQKFYMKSDKEKKIIIEIYNSLKKDTSDEDIVEIYLFLKRHHLIDNEGYILIDEFKPLYSNLFSNERHNAVEREKRKYIKNAEYYRLNSNIYQKTKEREILSKIMSKFGISGGKRKIKHRKTLKRRRSRRHTRRHY